MTPVPKTRPRVIFLMGETRSLITTGNGSTKITKSAIQEKTPTTTCIQVDFAQRAKTPGPHISPILGRQ